MLLEGVREIDRQTDRQAGTRWINREKVKGEG